MKGVISLRIEPSLLEEIDKATKEEGKSRTVFIKEAVRYYLQNARRKDSSEGFVPFPEYKKVNEELKGALERIKELEKEVVSLKRENESLKRKKKRWLF